MNFGLVDPTKCGVSLVEALLRFPHFGGGHFRVLLDKLAKHD
jgi:hypothetical protein